MPKARPLSLGGTSAAQAKPTRCADSAWFGVGSRDRRANSGRPQGRIFQSPGLTHTHRGTSVTVPTTNDDFTETGYSVPPQRLALPGGVGHLFPGRVHGQFHPVGTALCGEPFAHHRTLADDVEHQACGSCRDAVFYLWATKGLQKWLPDLAVDWADRIKPGDLPVAIPDGYMTPRRRSSIRRRIIKQVFQVWNLSGKYALGACLDDPEIRHRAETIGVPVQPDVLPRWGESALEGLRSRQEPWDLLVDIVSPDRLNELELGEATPDIDELTRFGRAYLDRIAATPSDSRGPFVKLVHDLATPTGEHRYFIEYIRRTDDWTHVDPAFGRFRWTAAGVLDGSDLSDT